MFWKKKPEGEAGAEKLSGPKEIPEPIGQHLVVTFKLDPDWVWGLKAVLRLRPDSKSIFDFRLFDDGKAAQQNVKVRDYNQIREHPDLILYSGWFDKKTRNVHIESIPKA